MSCHSHSVDPSSLLHACNCNRYLQVHNVTRAGCEKANTGQFELLRVLGQVRPH